MKKMRNFIIYPTQFHLHHSDKRLKKYRANTVRMFLNSSEIRYFQNSSKLVQNLKKLTTWERCEISLSIQRRFICIIRTNGWKNIAQIPPARCRIRPKFGIFKIIQNPCRIKKNLQHEKVAKFHYLFNGISYASFG